MTETDIKNKSFFKKTDYLVTKILKIILIIAFFPIIIGYYSFNFLFYSILPNTIKFLYYTILNLSNLTEVMINLINKFTLMIIHYIYLCLKIYFNFLNKIISWIKKKLLNFVKIAFLHTINLINKLIMFTKKILIILENIFKKTILILSQNKDILMLIFYNLYEIIKNFTSFLFQQILYPYVYIYLKRIISELFIILCNYVKIFQKIIENIFNILIELILKFITKINNKFYLLMNFLNEKIKILRLFSSQKLIIILNFIKSIFNFFAVKINHYNKIMKNYVFKLLNSIKKLIIDYLKFLNKYLRKYLNFLNFRFLLSIFKIFYGYLKVFIVSIYIKAYNYFFIVLIKFGKINLI